METLESKLMNKSYELEKELSKHEPQEKAQLRPVSVKVDEDHKRSTVLLSVGDVTLSISVKQARDLAAALKKSAALIDGDDIDRGLTHKSKRHGR